VRPAARDAIVAWWADWYAREPLHYRHYVAWRAGLKERRAQRTTLDSLAAAHDTLVLHPLLDIEFLGGLASEFGWRGPHDRTAAMRQLFGDVLPRELVERESKAVFGGALFSDHSRAFGCDWGGDGVDPELVDVGVLRDLWARPDPPAGTALLMQQAWLATASGDPDSAGRAASEDA
jgi:asparagine synthase (glutamine-hydrolysing)